MKIFLILITLASFVAYGSDYTLSVKEHNYRVETSSLNKQYWLATHKVNNNSPAPLLIYLHGRGGVSDSLEKIEGQVKQIVKHAAKYSGSPFYFVAPQTTKSFIQGGGWVVPELNNLLVQLKQQYNIDSSRIYLMGNSMGGMGTWIWASSVPEHFAAVTPISGGLKDKMKQYIPNGVDITKGLANTPVWAFAGGKDKVVPAELSLNLIEDIQKEGNDNAKFKLYPKAKHNVRTEIFSSAEIYNWLFKQKRT